MGISGPAVLRFVGGGELLVGRIHLLGPRGSWGSALGLESSGFRGGGDVGLGQTSGRMVGTTRP